MSKHNQKVEPARFEPAASPSAGWAAAGEDNATTTRTCAGERPNWVMPALGSLVVLALLVFFWLPRQIDTGSIEVDAGESAPNRGKPAAVDVSPWSDAQLARQRKDAQAILAELLDEQFALEELAVERWAAEEFAAAQASAATGDEQYRTQQYLEAASTYQLALDEMLAVKARVDTEFEEQMRLGLEALRSDQGQPAVEALDLAVTLRPEDLAAQQALERAHKLEPLLALLLQANEARDSGDLEQALAMLRQAHAMDKQHAGAEAQLRSVEREIARRDFNAAMTAGYAALDEARYDEAERQFLKAQKILPSAGETENALLQTRNSRIRAKIDAFGARAEEAEDRESWDQAIAAYREILALDETVIFARAGLIRSQTRSTLDKRLSEALAKPERLGDDRIYQQTRSLYQQALSLEKKGPLLRKQLSALDELLQLAIVPIPVLLHSDEQTDVTVYKVAHLGTFRRQQLSLKPGTYTAVGVRNGYRDVRLEFTVAHNRDNNIVEISCTEPI
jgi:tetratricopeptide (TPR) repeat protein